MDALKDFNFWSVVAFVVPGLLLVEARSIGARGGLAPITKESVVAFIIVTVIYNFVLYLFGAPIPTPDSISKTGPSQLFNFVLLPSLIGLLLGLAERNYVIQRLLLPLGINAPSPIRTAWDVVFSQLLTGTYLIVLLKDGRQYNAMVTADSRFGSDAENPDLYLGQTYSLTDWTPSNPTRGVYIRGEEIQSVEIIRRP